MNTIFEILMGILPAIIAGFFTFYITKYTYSKNQPLDKLEIAYNRVYYPIYRLMLNDDDMDIVIKRGKYYFEKYDKYIDKSTRKLFNLLCNCSKEAEKRNIYKTFKNNVYDRNFYLRRRLGYLESGFVEMYKYSQPVEKSFFRVAIEMCFIYFLFIACYVVKNIFPTIFIILCVIVLFLFVIVICEILYCFFRFLYFKIRK
ncbi:hypothetical protein C819_02706 [Lachnospiraceae bacterium 10-1]|nr:hypothetical protein C819_02706 [Lachnospiraceae bacterium 10-1]